MAATGNLEYLPQARYTIETQRHVLPWWPAGGGEFRAQSTDDTGWWALALTSMHALTGGEAPFLDIAKLDEAYIWSYWTGGDSTGGGAVCGGGIIVSYAKQLLELFYLLSPIELASLLALRTCFFVFVNGSSHS